jgi:hypothetical protein
MGLDPSGVMCTAIRAGNIGLKSGQEFFPEGEILRREHGGNMKSDPGGRTPYGSINSWNCRSNRNSSRCGSARSDIIL